MNKRIIAALLTGCMLVSFTACNSGSDNRETTFDKETMNTVNPDISEPNQSIPSDAMITETETEITTPAKNGNTYTVNGVEYTISVRIEDYLYDIDGSDAKYIDLDRFFGAYGFTSSEKWPEERCYYENSDDISIHLDRKDTAFFSNNGLGVCSYVSMAYPSDCSVDETISSIEISRDYSLDINNHVYVVNGNVENDKLHEKYCVSQEMLVALAVMLDTLNDAGSMALAIDSLTHAFSSNYIGDGVVKLYLK